MRILHCISTLEVGGAERQLGIMAAAQARRGSAVHVAYLRGGLHQQILEDNGVALHQLAHKGNLDPALTVRLIALVQKVKPTIVQTWLTQMDVLGGLAAKVTGNPWIIAERSSAEAYPAGWRQRTRSLLARSADLIIANSDGGRDYWRTAAPNTRTEVIGNAVPLDQIRGAPAAALPPRTVLFVGRLAHEKRVDSLLRGYAATASDSIGPLVLCGDGPERPALETLADQLGIRQRIQFLGIRSDVWSLLQGAAAVVNPSAFEGCPNAVIEAMAAGRPVVVSDIPAHRSLLSGNEAAIVDADDPTELAAALAESVTDSPEVRRRVAGATDQVGKLGVDSILAAYDAAYQGVLARRERR